MSLGPIKRYLRLFPSLVFSPWLVTGSEMNGGSVISDTENKIKNARIFPQNVYPKFSILLKDYTRSVIHSAGIAIQDPLNYEARSNIMCVCYHGLKSISCLFQGTRLGSS